MCTLLLAYQIHPQYDLIFLGNRDEFKNRPTLRAHYWESHPTVLAGIDLEKGGTWTGITKEGCLAFITNYRDFSIPSHSILSRGFLTRDFLIQSVGPLPYLQEVQRKRKEYDPFNLILGNRRELWFYSNIEDKITPLKPGLYGLSNALLDTPWHKVTKAKDQLQALLKAPFKVDQLFAILDSTEGAPDDQLPHTGASLEMERLLSSIHIDSPDYGTRFKTVILIDKSGTVEFHEASLDEQGQWKRSSFQFHLEQ